MPDVSSRAPAVVRVRAALDVHKRTIVCASQPDDPRAGELRVQEIPNSERAVLKDSRAHGIDPLLTYSAGMTGNYEPLIGLPYPRMLHQKLLAMRDLGLKRISALGGLANTTATQTVLPVNAVGDGQRLGEIPYTLAGAGTLIIVEVR